MSRSSSTSKASAFKREKQQLHRMSMDSSMEPSSVQCNLLSFTHHLLIMVWQKEQPNSPRLTELTHSRKPTTKHWPRTPLLRLSKLLDPMSNGTTKKGSEPPSLPGSPSPKTKTQAAKEKGDPSNPGKSRVSSTKSPSPPTNRTSLLPLSLVLLCFAGLLPSGVQQQQKNLESQQQIHQTWIERRFILLSSTGSAAQNHICWQGQAHSQGEARTNQHASLSVPFL